ncbi:MAG: hypothetical protein Q4B14_03185 [Clostridia bacterium]|nr:hypothetical protein [Clostridia bacterium]
MTKFIDNNGLLYFWSKLKDKFVAKQDGKGLSTNDYTTDEKNKLLSLSNIEIVDNLTSTDSTKALSANQGSVLLSKIENSGGDMYTSVYDTNGNGKVDSAENADTLENHPASYFAAADSLKQLAFSAEYSDILNAPVISTDISADASADDKTVSPKAVKTYVDAKTSSVFKPAGSIAFAQLPELSSDVLGNVYNITDDFTTTDSFLEGSGKSYPAGTNVVVCEPESGVFKFDVLPGFIDLSSYYNTSNLVELTNTEIDEILAS